MTMEPTPLREAFFAEALNDPYTHALKHLWTEAWAQGYEQALRDCAEAARRKRNEGAAGSYFSIEAFCDWFRERRTWSERLTDALEFLTQDHKRREAEMVVAMAAIGRALKKPPTGSAP